MKDWNQSLGEQKGIENGFIQIKNNRFFLLYSYLKMSSRK